MAETEHLLPINLTLFIKFGYDIKTLSEIEKTQSKMLYCAYLNESIFKILKYSLENDVDFGDGLIDLTKIGAAISKVLIAEIDQIEAKSKSTKKNYNTDLLVPNNEISISNI